MTTYLRIFIKPDGHNWLDLPLVDGGDATSVFSVASREGAIIHPTFFVPMDSVLFTATFQLETQAVPKPTIVPFPTKAPPPVWPGLTPDPSKMPPDTPA